jgi:hypothetical protein
MKSARYPLFALALLAARLGLAQTAPPPTLERPLVLSPAVGETIDRAEKAKFGLFMFYSADDFSEATFYRALRADSLITLRVRLTDGRTAARPYTQAEFLALRGSIEQRLAELGEPMPPAPAGPPVAPGSAANYSFELGQHYRLETQNGSFSGQLTSMSLTVVELTSPDGTKVSVPRSSIARVLPADGGTPAASRIGANRPSNYYDTGNGNRLFFGPTARGLRKNEATFHDVNVFLVGVNYGVTNYFSIGGYASLIPGISLTEQILVLTPKLSVPLSEKVHVGAGVLYLRVPYDNNREAAGAGIGYGVATYGTADNNVTLGVGYTFADFGDYDNSDHGAVVLQLAGQTRVARRVSLVSENYLIPDSRPVLLGLEGVRLSWPRISLGIAALLYCQFPYEMNYNGYIDREPGEVYLVPAYVDFTFRFGKGAVAK